MSEHALCLRVSIITSYIKYGHFITGLQVLALGFVFAALFYKSHLPPVQNLWNSNESAR